MKAIPREDLDAAVKALCREVAAMILQGMAFRKMGFAEMAERLGEEESTVRGWLIDFVDANERGQSHLRVISDMAYALDCNVAFKLQPYDTVSSPQAQRTSSEERSDPVSPEAPIQPDTPKFP